MQEGFCYTYVSQSEIRVLFCCPLEKLQALIVPLVPEIITLQVELIGFRVRRIALNEFLLLFTRQPQPQLLRNLTRNRLLDPKHVRDFALVLLAPKLRAR